MGTGQHPFPLPSVLYTTVIPTDASFRLTTCSRRFLAPLIFGNEDGGDTILRNVVSYTDYTVIYNQKMSNFITTAMETSIPAYF
jgi:hypothetical protein